MRSGEPPGCCAPLSRVSQKEQVGRLPLQILFLHLPQESVGKQGGANFQGRNKGEIVEGGIVFALGGMKGRHGAASSLAENHEHIKLYRSDSSTCPTNLYSKLLTS